jgi:hypothetical protein
MHRKLGLPKGWHSARVGLPDEKLVAHSAKVTAQLDELLATRDGTQDIQNTTSESLDAAFETENAGSGTVDTELASVHDSEMEFSQTDWVVRSGA